MLWFYNSIKKIIKKKKKKTGKKKEDDDTFPRKKVEQNQNSTNIMVSLDGKGTVFPVKLKLQGD